MMRKIYNYEQVCDLYDELHYEEINVHGAYIGTLEILEELRPDHYHALIAKFIKTRFELIEPHDMSEDEKDILIFIDEPHFVLCE